MLQRSDAETLAVRFGLTGPGAGTDEPAVLTGPVDRGELGQVWRLQAGGADYAVKETFAALDPAQVARAAELERRVSAAGVRVPAQRSTVGGEPSLILRGTTVRVYDWVELQPADRGLDPTTLGRLLAALHRAAPTTRDPVDPFYWCPVGAGRWHALAEQAQRAGAPFAAALQHRLPSLIEAESIMVEPGTELIVSHRDLWADNIRRHVRRHVHRRGTAAVSEEVVVIDWDNCGPASPNQELAMLVVEFASGTAGPSRAAALVAAYRRAGGPGDLTDLPDFTMPLAILAHLVELDVRRWLDADARLPAGATVRQRSARRITEYTDDPLTPVDVRALLEAIR